eukprot:934307-Pelagomonas_calceolata.AAC.3
MKVEPLFQAAIVLSLDGNGSLNIRYTMDIITLSPNRVMGRCVIESGRAELFLTTNTAAMPQLTHICDGSKCIYIVWERGDA